MIKAIKKLKIWSKKKKRKKNHLLHPPPPPPPPPHCCFCSTIRPSAPPLPPWLDYEQTQNPISVSSTFPVSSFDTPTTSQPFIFTNCF
ncbi:hypothetical protein BVC80_8839g28 [Macleaya cordata]|uniref:Uncharacterized protein n=1 Tax=Macleaya cordata TaxID=56857 RepID=A0A200RDZ3_MACCD|nr:hypothetical protein BVC80_8839g28 [Macleaya cordata]